ncbi:MAG TPA: signal peptidase I [Capsulimonadaceae bacterium]|jgi:signal peptidase I
MTDLSQQLADVHASSIMYLVVFLTVVRFMIIKRESSVARGIVELVDAALFAAVLMFMIVLPFIVKSFYIPSGSMRPTLVDDDHILVNKFQFRTGEPSRGDVVVFTAPDRALQNSSERPEPGDAPTDYIKRLIGLPGDVIEVHGGVIKIGPKGNQQYKTHQDVRIALQLADNDHQHVKFLENGVQAFDGSTTTTYTKEEIAEKLGFAGQPVEIDPGVVIRNGKPLVEPYIAEDPEYDLKVYTGQSVIRDNNGIRMNSQEFLLGSKGFDKLNSEPLPPKRVMVFGDNRNDSNDSSRWGPLERERLVGRAFLIFYPFDRMRMIH